MWPNAETTYEIRYLHEIAKREKDGKLDNKIFFCLNVYKIFIVKKKKFLFVSLELLK